MKRKASSVQTCTFMNSIFGHSIQADIAAEFLKAVHSPQIIQRFTLIKVLYMVSRGRRKIWIARARAARKDFTNRDTLSLNIHRNK